MVEYILPIVIIAILILLNGFFVAAEFAIVGAPPTRIAQKAEAGSRLAERVLLILRDPVEQNRYLATAQLGITIASLGLGMYGEHTVAEWLIGPLESLGRLAQPAAHTVSIVISVGFLTYLHVVLGEMVPKSISLGSAETTVMRLARPMIVIERVFYPVVAVLNGIGNWIIRLIGIPSAGEQARLFSPQELEYIVEESYAGGLLDPEERLYLENIFDLSERSVGQVMTPRTRIVGLPIESDENAVLRRACQARFTRLPVYKGDLDHIHGIVHLKELARQQTHPDEEFDLRKLSRQPIFVPESLSLEALLVRFRKEGLQMAIVIDEFGGTAGLVTLEDLVEEVVGEIRDEFDQEIDPIQQIGPWKLRVRGDLLLDELNQHYNLNLAHENADTIGGFVMTILGKVLRPGDVVETQGIRIEVETVKGLAVQTLLIYLPPKGAESTPFSETDPRPAKSNSSQLFASGQDSSN